MCLESKLAGLKWENVLEIKYLNSLKIGGLFGSLKAELSNTAFVIKEVKYLQESSTICL